MLTAGTVRLHATHFRVLWSKANMGLHSHVQFACPFTQNELFGFIIPEAKA
jgi:hypothetical protein